MSSDFDYNYFRESLFKYQNTQTPDYAILVNGEWGAGKTYYINHTLLKDECYLSNQELTTVVVSVAGCSAPEDVIVKIQEQYLFNRINAVLPSNLTAQNFIKIASYLPEEVTSKRIVKYSNKVINNLKASISEKQSPEISIFIDDLERYGDRQNVDQLMGQLHDAYINKGAHIVYIANEKELMSNDDTTGANRAYAKSKEKYIRYTLQFIPDFDDVICNVLESNDSVFQYFAALYKENKSCILGQFQERSTLNLRFIIQAMECYEFFVRHAIPSSKGQVHLFLNIVILVRYKNALLENPSLEFNEFVKTVGLKDNQLKAFYADSMGKYRLDCYYRYDEILEYLKSGYLAEDEIRKFMEENYPQDNEYVDELLELSSNYPTKSELDIKNSWKTMKEGLSSYEMPYSMIPRIANISGAILFDMPEMETEVLNVLLEAIGDGNYKGRNDFLLNYRNELMPGHFPIEDIVNEALMKERLKIQGASEEQKFRIAFSRISDHDYRDSLIDFKGKVFELMKKYDLLNELNTMNNKALYNLNVEAYGLSQGNALSQKTIIEEMISILDSRKTLSESKVDQNRIGELIRQLKKSISIENDTE